MDGGSGAAGAPAAVLETHGSVVLLVGDRAYKFLKPVRTPYFDYTTVERRRRACEREVELNRRLAPDCYLGVSPLWEGDEVADHVVVMRRLPHDRRLAVLAATPDGAAHVRTVARAVAAFHAGLPPDPGAAELLRVDALTALWTTGNLDELDARADGLLDGGALAEVRRLATRYLAGRAPLLAARVAAGRAVDGHGDLLADDVFCLDDGPRILDCLAFDDDLRRGDVVADVAFLAMDLERLAGPGAAGLLESEWRSITGDDAPASWWHHWVAERALVRAKVRSLRATQGDDADCRAAAADAVGFLEQCRTHLRAGAVRLELVGGAPGTGKTTMARLRAGGLGAVLLSSDAVRADVLGERPGDGGRGGTGLDAGRYGPGERAAVYDEVLRRAGEHLGLGRSVVLDATWADAAARRAARELADRTSSDLAEWRCVVAPEVAAARVAARLARGGDASEATPEVARAVAARFDPWPEAAVVDTS